MRKWLVIFLFVCLLVSGLYFWWGLTGVQPLQEKVLKFAEVKKVPSIRDSISATGTVEPREIVLVSSEIPGTVMRLSPRDEKLQSISLGIGDVVYEGAPLAYLDDRRIKLKEQEAKTGIAMADAAVKQANAALEQAKATKAAADRFLDTQIRLEQTNVGIKSEKEQAKAQADAADAGIKVAEAGIAAANSKLEAARTAHREALLACDLTRILVPGDLTSKERRKYLILDRKVNVGQMVGPQSGPLFTLAGSLDEVELHAQVVEGDVNKIGEGLKAYFKVNNFNDGETDFEGTVQSIRPMASNIKGAVYYNAVIRVKNRQEPKTGEWQLRPGMTAPVDIVRLERKNAWHVPAAALNFTLEEAYQSDAAKAKVAQWAQRPDAKDWRALWIWDSATHQPQPIFIRVVPKQDEVGLKDLDGNEILEWEPGKEPTGPIRVITDAPKSKPPGFFDQPANVKI